MACEWSILLAVFYTVIRTPLNFAWVWKQSPFPILYLLLYCYLHFIVHYFRVSVCDLLEGVIVPEITGPFDYKRYNFDACDIDRYYAPALEMAVSTSAHS